MNIFKAIGQITASFTEFFVTSAKACNNVALMAKESTDAMLAEQREEAKQELARLKAVELM